MHLIYNSEQYSVVEFGSDHDRHALRFGAYEIMDKPAQREAFIDGELAANFREHVRDLIAIESSTEEIDEFLAGYDLLMTQSLVFH